MNEGKRVKIGIFSFAHVHAPSYAEAVKKIEGAKLTGIYDRNETRGKGVADNFETEYFEDMEELLNKTDGAIITSENSLHKDMVLKSAEAGNDILCEKPLATELDDAKIMIEICKNNDVSLHTAFPMRYTPPVKSLKEQIDNGKIGKILGISSTNHGTLNGLPEWFYDEELAGGGAVMDHTVHLIDLFRWIFEKEIERVYAELETLLHDIKVEDCGILSVEFDNGLSATVDCSWSRPKSFPTWGDLKIRVYGTEGVIDMSAFQQKFTVYSDKMGKGEKVYWGTDFDLAMIKDYIRVIQGKSTEGALATGEDGKKALESTLAAYKSSKKEKFVRV